MVCKQCSASLPDESLFCPYCMAKFTEKNSNRQKLNALKITAALIAVLLVASVIVALLINSKTAEKENSTSVQTQSPSAQQTTVNNGSQSEKIAAETSTAVINGEYYEPGTYFWNINANGEIVLEDYENYPF